MHELHTLKKETFMYSIHMQIATSYNLLRTDASHECELRRFLGIINQLSKFAPNLADKTKPLRELLSTRNHWKWDASQEQAFKKLKALLSSSEVLALYDPSLEFTVSADASAYGLGSVLRHKPLLSIKSLDEMPLRIQRFRLRHHFTCSR